MMTDDNPFLYQTRCKKCGKRFNNDKRGEHRDYCPLCYAWVNSLKSSSEVG